MELELISPPDKIPTGVIFSVKHLMMVPSSPEIENCLQASDDIHSLVKIKKAGGNLETEIIEDFGSITSEYFTTGKLQNQSLCFITTVGRPECLHSSIKRITIVQDRQMCPSEKNALAAYIACENDDSKKILEQDLEEKYEQKTRAFIKQNISQSNDYQLKIRFDGLDWYDQ